MENSWNYDDHIYFEESWNDETKETKSKIVSTFLTPYDDINEKREKKEENIDNIYNWD